MKRPNIFLGIEVVPINGDESLKAHLPEIVRAFEETARRQRRQRPQAEAGQRPESPALSSTPNQEA